jgi:Antirestriction protein
MTEKTITCSIVPEAERLAFVDKLFGISYVTQLEPTVFNMAERLSSQYNGGYWQFHALGNAGFYMSPRLDTIFNVSCENGFVGKLTADALGLAACLYAYSHLSFGDGTFAESCGTQYHLLREYMFEHAEVRALLAAID